MRMLWEGWFVRVHFKRILGPGFYLGTRSRRMESKDSTCTGIQQSTQQTLAIEGKEHTFGITGTRANGATIGIPTMDQINRLR